MTINKTIITKLKKPTVDQSNYRSLLPEGFSLHWYTIKSVLGQGGSGVTYLAHDNNLDSLVAIKEYFPVDYSYREEGLSVRATETRSNDMYQWGLDRFIKEARVLARFKHPNIVRVFSVFEQNNTAYMVMEYEHGKPLARFFKENVKPTQVELLNIFIPILDGLHLVHSEHFIHRDIKPSNIYIRNDGSPVLIDFGAARRVKDLAATQQLTSIVTYGYAPFEQYNEGDEKQGPWSDIYALGACLYVAVVGSPPVEAMARGASMLSKGIDPYRPVSVHATEHYSGSFLRAIDHALMFYAEDRPQSVTEWMDMLTGRVEVPELPEDMQKAVGVDDAETVVMPFSPSQRRSSVLRAPSRRMESARETATAPAKKPVKKLPTALIVSIGVVALVAVGAIVFALSNMSDMSEVAVHNDPVPHEPITQVAVQDGQVETVVPVSPEVENAPAVEDTDAHESATNVPIASRDQELQELLVLAEEAYQNKQLVGPGDGNALTYYRQALGVEADNAEARQGIDKIERYFEQLIESDIGQGNLDAAEQNLVILESIAPDSIALENLRDVIADKKANEAVDRLLSRAEEALNANRLTVPAQDNAVYYYREVLKLAPENPQALQGIENIQDRLKRLFEARLSAKNYASARAIVRNVERIFPDSSLAQELTNSLPVNAPVKTSTSEISQIKHALSVFKEAFEQKNIAKVRKVSEVETGDLLFYERVFAFYRSFKVEYDNFRHLGSEKRGIAEVRLTDFIGQDGRAVEPGEWSRFNIVVKKDASGEWKVYW